jgi:hypothetical protein
MNHMFVAELLACKASNNVSISKVLVFFFGRHPQTRIFVVVWRADGDVYAHEIKIYGQNVPVVYLRMLLIQRVLFPLLQQFYQDTFNYLESDTTRILASTPTSGDRTYRVDPFEML